MKRLLTLLILLISLTSYGQFGMFQAHNRGYSISSVFDLIYESNSGLISEISDKFSSITFKTDGTKMYAYSNNGNTYQYSLSTPWDVTTLSYDAVSHNPTEINSARAIASTISEDGVNLYIIDNISQKIYQYVLTTAWDLSTAPTSATNEKVISISYSKIDIQPGGNSASIAGFSNDVLYNYSLTTPYDISTLVLTSTDSQQLDSFSYDYNEDGTRLYVQSNDGNIISQFDMGTSFIGSTLSNEQTDTADSFTYTQNSYCVIGNSSSNLYIINPTENSVYQYEITN